MPEKTTAGQIMTTKLVTLSPKDNVMKAVEVLLKYKISGAPVVNEDGALVGILSELDCVNDIINSAMTNELPSAVEDRMTKDVLTVGPDATLLSVGHIFSTKRYRRLPVVDATGRLLGQLSRRDLMRALYDIMRVRQNKKSGPLYLSAIYGSDEAPAKITHDLG